MMVLLAHQISHDLNELPVSCGVQHRSWLIRISVSAPVERFGISNTLLRANRDVFNLCIEDQRQNRTR